MKLVTHYHRRFDFMSTFVLTMVLPTTRTDGSPLAHTDIDHVEIFDMASPTPAVAIGNVSGAATTFSGPAAVGDHGYTFVVVDTGGRRSAPSNVAAATVVAPPPPVTAPPSAGTASVVINP